MQKLVKTLKTKVFKVGLNSLKLIDTFFTGIKRRRKKSVKKWIERMKKKLRIRFSKKRKEIKLLPTKKLFFDSSGINEATGKLNDG